ncbi:MAG: hypothetical protein JWN20_2658 [Jatrophihabitantaceae bacterium]|nr:hypothetical protein [Jatrophihabitantaceae bacterium]
MMRARTICGSLLMLLAVSAVAVPVSGQGSAASAKPVFSLGVSPGGQSVQQGETATYIVTVLGAGGWSSAVALSVSGLPAGVSAAFSDQLVTPTSTAPSQSLALSVAISKTASAAASSFTITGTSGPTKNSVKVGLTVNPTLNGYIALTANPSSVVVAPGSSAVYTISLTRAGGFTGAVDFSTYGNLPAGATATVDPSHLSATATSSTLQVATIAAANSTTATPDGSYVIYLLASYLRPGTNEKAYQYVRVTVVVDSKHSSKAFSISGGSPAAALAPGMADQPLDLAITNSGNQSLPVTNLVVTVSGTSAGAACSPANFAVQQYTGPYPLNVPAGAQARTLSSLGIPAGQQPQLRLVDLPTNQDGCKGVTVNLSYSGSAEGN